MSSPLGLLNLDKPPGLTSREVVDRVQRLVRPAKAGHAGTLDPLATGVLVVCIGPATRLISFVQRGRKVYQARFRFGVRSETDDTEAECVEVAEAPRLSADEIRGALPAFVGRIEQVPPAYSAVHVGGKRSYELARAGETVVLAARPVDVFRFDLLAFHAATQELDCEVECGSGTYVRSLGRDLASRLGTVAVMTSLRRTAVGPFRVDDALSVEGLDRDRLAAGLYPPESAVAGWPRAVCDPQQVAAVRNGRALPLPSGLRMADGEAAGLFDAGGGMIAVAEFDARDATLRPKIVFPAG